MMTLLSRQQYPCRTAQRPEPRAVARCLLLYGVPRVGDAGTGKHDVGLKIVLAHGVRCLRVVFAHQGAAAEAIRRIIIHRKRETEQVRRKPSKIEPRIGPTARLEAIKIELTIDAAVDAVPTQCAMDRSRRLLPVRS